MTLAKSRVTIIIKKITIPKTIPSQKISYSFGNFSTDNKCG